MLTSALDATVIDQYRSRAEWDAVAAGLVATMLERWQLTPGEAFTGGEAGAVLRVARADGTPGVLKVGYPHLESVWEAVALETWSEHAPAVLRQDVTTWALLLERIEPGIPLSRAELDPAEAVAIAARLHARLTSVPAPDGIPSLAQHVDHFTGIARAQLGGWAAQLDRLGAARLVPAALDELVALAADPAPGMLLHGDYNPGNLLAAHDGEWRVIDPSPLTGDPAFDAWPLIEQLGAPWERSDPEVVLSDNAIVFSELTGMDRDRILRWATGRAGLNITWYLEDGELDLAAREVGKIQALQRMR